ncbi:MAG: HAD-IIIA family hydrolase [Verrucomicrobia bacterium]|nr:HAD-IIIA family hydrolase [Verrucomicrobiota bacterium]
MNPQPAIFLDRDGTLIEDRGHLRSTAEVAFFPATVPALRRLQPHFRLFIVTNQPGVSLGEVTMADVQRVNDHVVARLRAAGVEIVAVYCCPHQRSEGCACIKPKPFFMEQAVREHGVDLGHSFTVGDHPHDVHLACNAGATGIFVLTGHGMKHRDELGADDVVAKDIEEAADIILRLRSERSHATAH